MSTKLSMTRDINGYNAFGVLPTQDIYKTTLAANVAQSFTVPSNHPVWLAIMSYGPGASVLVDVNHTATVATGAFTATTSALNPAGRQVKAGDVMSFITTDAFSPIVSVELQAIPPYID